MEVKYYKSEVADPKRMVNPVDVINENCSRLDYVLKYIGQLKPKRVKDYVLALEKRLREDIESFHIDYSGLGLDEMTKELNQLERFPDLKALMIQFAFYQLNLPGLSSGLAQVYQCFPIS